MSIDDSRESAPCIPAGPRRISLVRVAALTLAIGAAAGTLTDRVVLAADPVQVPVHLDEELSIRFRSAVSKRRLGADTIRIRTADGRQAQGATLLGRFVFDDREQRRVVIRPEAVQEYYELQLRMTREAATKKAARLLASIERTGKIKKLQAVDRGLQNSFGPGYEAGTRLDDDNVVATYPAAVNPADPLRTYRRGIAGDDDLWLDYAIDRNPAAFEELRTNPEFERFFHPVDADTGVADPESVLRRREHRRVLIRRNRRTVLFIPRLPSRADVTDAGFEPGETYELSVERPLRAAKRITTGLGLTSRLPGGRITLLTAELPTLFAGVDERVGVSGGQRPRIVNVTPPNGEQFVDATTDWEDPDNSFEVAEPARRTFTVRLRFAQPLDPRTVDETTFTLTKVVVNPGTPAERAVQVPIAVGVFLAQSRLGEVRVDVTPELNLDPGCRYEVRARGIVRSLSGEFLSLDYRSTFETY